MTQVPRSASKRTTLSRTPMPVSAHGASSSPTSRTVSAGWAGVSIAMVVPPGWSGGQRRERIEVEGGLEGGGGAQDDQVAVLGSHQLQADGQAAGAGAAAHGGGGRARHVERVG